MKDRLKHLLRRLFELTQRVGFDLLPRHFYSDVPDIAALRSSDLWRRPLTLTEVGGTEIAHQRAFVSECCSREASSRLAGRDIYDEACRANGAVGYGPIEAAFLYCFTASRRPPRVIQVGAGVSTAVIQSAARDFELDIEVVCIDPFPTEFLKQEARLGQIELIEKPVQEVEPEYLASVGPGGLLFVDATHTVKVGSDVNYLVLEVLPRISDRATVHFHDITLPYDFSPTILEDDLFFWNETVLVTAFLTGNPRFRIGACLSMLHEACPEALREPFPWYSPRPQDRGIAAGSGHFPSAAYLEANYLEAPR